MNDFEKLKITESEKEKYRISNLADRPNAMSSYRKSKMSAEDVKKTFDAQMDFLARKHNELVDEESFLAELYGDLDEAMAALKTLASQVFSTQVVVWEGDILNLVDKVYPIGAIYISAKSNSPTELFGGTWAEIEGRFLIGVGGEISAGDCGGSATHTHTDMSTLHAAVWQTSYEYDSTRGDSANNIAFLKSDYETTATKPTFISTGTTNKTYSDGGGSFLQKGVAIRGTLSGDNLPPYLGVYMWQRIE